MNTEKEIDKILECLDPDICRCRGCMRDFSIKIQRMKMFTINGYCLVCWFYCGDVYRIYIEENGVGKKWIEDLYLNKYEAYINDQGFAALRDK